MQYVINAGHTKIVFSKKYKAIVKNGLKMSSVAEISMYKDASTSGNSDIEKQPKSKRIKIIFFKTKSTFLNVFSDF